MRATDTLRTRAAASSIASGMPSSCSQIIATCAAFSLVTVKFGRARTARSMKSCTASKRASDSTVTTSSAFGDRSDGTRHVTSPGRLSGWRLVVSTCSGGQPRSRDSTSSADSSSRCSQLSMSTSARASRSRGDDRVEQRLLDRALHVQDRGERRHDRARLAERCELHVPDAVGVAVDPVGRGLEREPRLAAAAGPGDGEQPRVVEQRVELRELGLTPDERRELGRQVVGDAVGTEQWWELGRQVVVGQLEHLLRAAQVLEPVRAEVEPRHPVRQRVAGEVHALTRRDHLAAVGEGPEPRGADDRLARVVARVAQLGVAGVQRHAHRNVDGGRPGLGCERPLRGERGRHRVRPTPEHRHDAVALALLHREHPAVRP